MLARATRWSLITAPVVAGVLVLVLGTAGATSVAFGATLIAISPLIWLCNWFIRMSFADDAREQERRQREQRARDQRSRAGRAGPDRAPQRPAPRHPAPSLGRRRRRPL